MDVVRKKEFSVFCFIKKNPTLVGVSNKVVLPQVELQNRVLHGGEYKSDIFRIYRKYKKNHINTSFKKIIDANKKNSSLPKIYQFLQQSTLPLYLKIF